MADLRLNHIFKVYDNGVKAVNDFCIDIKDQEFIVFVGPSGCGKSTTLRMIAGLEEITAGELYIGDNYVNDLEPSDRDIAMVFQNYALYPHMSVYDNMAFGLANRHTPKDEIKKRVTAAAEILGLSNYLDRKPKELSGGQCQRVALGRAIVRQPKVFLLDEPLSNLDAKLRASMRTEISKLHQQLQTTFIYVTHDQVEAMTMGTRIVVMKDGFIQQIDTPINLYNHPINKFVAGFIGTPQMNFYNCKLLLKDDDVIVSLSDKVKINISYKDHCKLDSRYLKNNKDVILGVRPDMFALSDKESELKVKASIIEQLGNESILYGNLLDVESESNITMKIDPKVEVKPGDIVNVIIKDENIHFFDAETEKSIKRVIPDFNYLPISVSNGEVKLWGNKYLLSDYLRNKLDGKKWICQIPPHAVIEGNDFSLDLIQQEHKYNHICSTLFGYNSYIFSTGFDECKKGKKSFAIDWTKVKFVNEEDENDVILPIQNSFILPISFNKDSNTMIIKNENKKTGAIVEKKKKHFALSFMVGNQKHFLSFTDTDKVLNIFGNKKTYKDVFDLRLDFDDIDFDTKMFDAKVLEHISYGDISFVKIDLFGTNIIIPDKSNGNDLISFSLKPKKIAIYEHNSNMRII